MDNHTTESYFMDGVVFSEDRGLIKKNIEVRYSKSDIEDTVSLSDNESCLIMVKADELRNVLKRYKK